MAATSARLRLSEEDLEGFISELWLTLERHHLPSPDLRLHCAGVGATTVELRFAHSEDLCRALRNMANPRTTFAI